MNKIQIFSLLIQIVLVILAILSYLGIESENLPVIIQSLLIVPWYYFIIGVLILLVIYLVVPKKRRGFPIAAIGRDLVKVGEASYNGVKWNILGPRQRSFETPEEYEKRLPDSIDVQIPPRCPKCGVELEEKKGLLLGYIWKCIGCGFSKRNWKSYYLEADRAKRLWKRACETGNLAEIK